MSEGNKTQKRSSNLEARATGRSLEGVLDQMAWEAGHIMRERSWMSAAMRNPPGFALRVWETVFAPKK